MKRCSTCNRTYTDPNLSFCIDDGTPLTVVAADDDTTVVRPRDNQDDEWNAVAYRPPSAYVPPGTPVKRRRVWPWVVGIAGAFVLGLLAISVAALIMVPRMKARQETERGRVVIQEPANSNTATENSNTNSNTNENVNTPPPGNHDQVLAHLKDLENEWMVANVNADKKKLDRILADDYVGQAGPEGTLETKAEYLQRTERDTQTEKWDMSNEKLTLTGDRATLEGIVTFFLHDGRVGSFDFKDKFVWRDGRWQATGSELKPREKVGTDL